MLTIISGERIGRLGKITLGCSATIFDNKRKKILLTKRSDNNQWCLPGGRVEAGEDVQEACIREVEEETGLTVRVVKLLGVYSNRNKLVKYSDESIGFQIVALNFEAEIIAGELGLSVETCDAGYFSLEDIGGMDMFDFHQDRIFDSFYLSQWPCIR